MSEIFRGVKPRDWVLAGGLTALGVVLMWFNTQTTGAMVDEAIAEGSMVHTMSSRSFWMIPVFAAATLPVLWWRRSLVAVTSISVAAMAPQRVTQPNSTTCSAIAEEELRQ